MRRRGVVTTESDQDPEPINAWNPMLDPVREQLRQQVQQDAARIPMRRAKFRRRLQMRMSKFATQPIDAIFGLVCLGTLTASAVIATLNWPIWGRGEAFEDVVLAAGSATALGSIVFSAVSTPFARAMDIAPGYTAVVLGQRSPWLGGLGIIAVAGTLLTYSTLEPTQAGANAAVLLAVSAVTWSWMSARRALSEADPLIVAQQAGTYYRKAIVRSTRLVRRGLSIGVAAVPPR